MRGSLFLVQLPICSLHNCCEKLQSFKPSQYSRGLALQIYALQFQPPNNFPSGTRVVF